MKLIIRRSSVQGLGIFAKQKIKAGEIIHIATGELMDHKTTMKRIDERRFKDDDPLQINERFYMELDEISRSFNHGCNPNAGLRGYNQFFTLRAIKAGEEIIWDYSTSVKK